MKRLFRTLHRKAAPILFLPLLATTLTGVGYRLGNSWFDIPERLADRLMAIHEGKIFGESLVPVYVLLMGVGLLGLVVTGLGLIRRVTTLPGQAKPGTTWRVWHQILAPLCFLPIALTAITGVIYRVGKNWLGLSDNKARIMMKLHEGAYFGQQLRPFYVLYAGIGLLALLITGMQMVKLRRQPTRPAIESVDKA